MNRIVHLGILLCLCAFMPALVAAEAGKEKSADSLMERAVAAYKVGDTERAVELAGKAIISEPSNPAPYRLRGRLQESRSRFLAAIEDYSKVLELDPEQTEVLQMRGETCFRAAQIKESLQDFDQYLKARPREAPFHWQRGIALYYAESYEEGRKQFELHQTVNDADVENAVWHFLCVAKRSGFKEAREQLLRVGADRRIPMMAIYDLFAGRGTAEEVLEAARADSGEPSVEELRGRLFYAHLYLGLYYEAAGEEGKARDHMRKAVQDHGMPHYMGDVARVHWKLRNWEVDGTK